MNKLDSIKKIFSGGKTKYIFANPLIISVIITIFIILICIIMFYKYISLRKMVGFSVLTFGVVTGLVFIENTLLSKKYEIPKNKIFDDKKYSSNMQKLDEELDKPYENNNQFNNSPFNQNIGIPTQNNISSSTQNTITNPSHTAVNNGFNNSDYNIKFG